MPSLLAAHRETNDGQVYHPEGKRGKKKKNEDVAKKKEDKNSHDTHKWGGRIEVGKINGLRSAPEKRLGKILFGVTRTRETEKKKKK